MYSYELCVLYVFLVLLPSSVYQACMLNLVMTSYHNIPMVNKKNKLKHIDWEIFDLTQRQTMCQQYFFPRKST